MEEITLIIIYKNQEISFNLSSNNMHINESHKIEKKEDMLAILKEIREVANKEGYIYKRTNESWLKEWRAHNWLHLNEIEEDRTGSVDLNEDESKLRLFVYNILSFFC
jgi:hypothetical protein